MSQSFLQSYQQLKQQSQQESLPMLSGLWLLHSDEPLTNQWLINAFKPFWRYHEQAVKRIDLVSSKTWQEVIAELESLSLFNPASAIIVTGNHKPDKNMIDTLSKYAQTISADSANNPHEVQHHLVWLTAKVDKRALSSKWIMPFSKFGTLIDGNIYNENQRLQILKMHAQHFGLTIADDAWELLIAHTQNNLLDSYQTLWRLSDLFASSQDGVSSTAMISIEQLQDAIVSESKFNVFDLSDAMLAGNHAQVVDIIYGLRNTDEPESLVLWAIAKDMRLIQQLHAGKSAQEIGIWRNKEFLYNQAARRISPSEIKTWSELMYRCDQSIKGIIKQPAWELILQAALQVTGVKLFAPNA